MTAFYPDLPRNHDRCTPSIYHPQPNCTRPFHILPYEAREMPMKTLAATKKRLNTNSTTPSLPYHQCFLVALHLQSPSKGVTAPQICKYAGDCMQSLSTHTLKSSYSITHRHPAVPSSPPLSLPNALLFDASSSSTMSCGLTVICTTFADSVLNLHSVGEASVSII